MKAYSGCRICESHVGQFIWKQGLHIYVYMTAVGQFEERN
jgi:hypothetical protein